MSDEPKCNEAYPHPLTGNVDKWPCCDLPKGHALPHVTYQTDTRPAQIWWSEAA